MTAPPRPLRWAFDPILEATADKWSMQAWAYIEWLELVNKNLRESCEILKALDAQKNRIIIELGGEVP